MFRIKNEFLKNLLFINENGTIKEVKFVSMRIVKQEDTHIVIWKYKHNDVEGEITTEYGKCPFCENVDTAIINCTMPCEDTITYVREKGGVKVLYDNNKFYLYVYTFRNGVIQQESVELSSILHEEKYYGVSVELVENVKYYETKEECIAFNKITKIDYSGNKSDLDYSGYMQDMVAYTEEQKKVIETLQKAFKDAKECGLQCLMGDEHLHLINVKNFPNYHVTDTDWDYSENMLKVYLTNKEKEVAMVDGIYHNCGERPAIVVE
jgi:hypothetical protein